MDELAARKQEIRAGILARRTGLTAQDRAARSGAICEAIRGIPGYAGAHSILFYMPFRGEVDTSPLLVEALRRGARCALPKCRGGCSLTLHGITDPVNDTEPGMWGIAEPKDCLCQWPADVFSAIIVPGVAFDRKGCRLGYGAGYYDRLLPCLSAGALKIAPAYAFQVLGELPCGQHDAAVDIVVTEEEIIDCRRAGRE